MPLFCLLTSQTTFGFFPLYVLANAIEFFFLPIDVFLCTSFSSFLSWQLPLSVIFFYFCSFIIVSFCPFLPNDRTEIKRFSFSKKNCSRSLLASKYYLSIEENRKGFEKAILQLFLNKSACTSVCVCVRARACVRVRERRKIELTVWRKKVPIALDGI